MAASQHFKDSAILPRIKEIKSLHPFWGSRRIWATLRFKDGLLINKKRVSRLLRIYDLGVSRRNLKANRTPQKEKPRADMPCQWWGIDMTKIMTDSGWAYITIVLDWYSKKIVGHHIGYQSKAKHWLEALNMAVQTNFPEGVRGNDLNLMSDNGCQPTSISFMKECKILEINQAFTSYNNPKGNADTERMMRTIKEECLWLESWQSLDEVKNVLTIWINKYNNEYLHSALGWNTPQTVHKTGIKTLRNTLLKVA